MQDRQSKIHSVLQKLDPPNSTKLLSRVQAFLPQLEASNAILAQADPKSVDIENVPEGAQYIEMNLGLGVFKDAGSDDESDDESSDDDSSDSTDIVTTTFKMLRPTKPLPKRSKEAQPRIEVLAESDL